MASVFEIKEHVIEGQHIREYPRATAHSGEEILQLSIKQYTPKDNPRPGHGDITIIGAHANGFPKETYEPFWEDLHSALGKKGVRIRSIWIADVAWQGQSGVINEDHLGNDPSWYDHPRDLLHMINHFRAEMPLPLVGIGHSFGGNAIVNLALLHPRLLTTLVLMEPVMANFSEQLPSFGLSPMMLTSMRRDLWPSRRAAEDAFTRNKFYQAWDPRVLRAWNQYGLRDTPTKLYPGEAGRATLTTTKHQEVFTFSRPTAQRYLAGGKREPDTALLPDGDFPGPDNQPRHPFYRPEGPITTSRLPSLRPGVLYIFGENSPVCGEQVRREKRKLTGVGVGGSGGVKAGRVADVTLEGLAHLVPMEVPTRCADLAAGWLVPELERWRQEDAEVRRWYAEKNDLEKQTMDDNWKTWIDEVKELLKPKI